MSHTCHAINCKTQTKPEMFMCLKHWRKVPKDLQRAIWKYYRPGQCDDWRPSPEYCNTAKKAVRSVAEKEGIIITGEEHELKLYDLFGAVNEPPKE